MNPIWDYVKKVERHLPHARRMQVAGALHATLKARKDAQEKTLGRGLTDAEIDAMLHAEGAPEAVATRLAGGDREHELLSRYLAAVERRLPREGVLDVLAELREALSARIEAREEQLGRTASADEVAEILKAYGHPVVVASKYSGNDYVIGPNLYPWFWYVQRIAVGLTLAIAFAIIAVRALGAEEPFGAALRGFWGALQGAMICFGVVTALFVIAERTKFDMKWAAKWDPKTLPREQIRERKSLFESFISVAFDIIFLLWWVKVVQWPAEIPTRDGGAAGIHFSAAWAAVWSPVLALSVAATVVHIADIIHPAWSRIRSVLSIAGHAVGIGVLWLLFQSRPLVAVTALNGAQQVEADRVFRLFDGILFLSLGIAGLIWAVAIGVEVWRLWRSVRPIEPPPLPA